MMNALPGVRGYKPMPSYQVLTDALDDYCRGAIDVRDKDLNVYQFAGDEAKLYQLTSTAWGDVSLMGGYATATEERWRFLLWKNKLLATNFSDYPQEITLGGSNFADLTTALKARQMAVVHEHIMAANTWDASDGNQPDRVWTSALGDETDWTASSLTGATVRNLGQGPIRRVFGGQYGVLLGDHTFRADWEGAPRWFNIQPTVPGVGTIAAEACCQLGTTIYSISQAGFVRIENGAGYVPIGAGRVDEYFFSDLDDSYLYRISCVADPKSGRVFWSYPGAGNTDGQPNKIIVYDSSIDKWGVIEVDTQLLWRAGGVGFTLEQLDTVSASIDDLPVSLDSSQWKGDATLTLAAFNGSNIHGFFQGSPMTAVFTTKELEIYDGHRTLLQSFMPLVERGTVTARVGWRNSLADEVQWTSSAARLASSGRVKRRKRARFHRFEITCAEDWEHAMGVSVDDFGARRSGRRGG